MIAWYQPEEFWRIVEARRGDGPSPDGSFTFQMPLQEIRGRIPMVAPTFTPVKEGDFPGPVERWYGSVGSCLFTMTFHYSGPLANLVVIEHQPGVQAEKIVKEAIDRWRSESPYG